MKRAGLCMVAPLTGMLAVAGMPAAQAASWQVYSNPRYGYTIDIPPGFTLQSEADNGDGATFAASGGASLLVFGTNLDGEFSQDAETRVGGEKDAQWTITYEKVTAAWASFSGVRKGDVLYERGVRLCDGGAGFFRLQYRKADIKRFNPLVTRMAKSLRPAAGCETRPSAGPDATGKRQN